MNKNTWTVSFIISFVGGVFAALAPNLWTEITAKWKSSDVSFVYEYDKSERSAWKNILEDQLGETQTTNRLIGEYKTEIEDQLKARGYTIERVMKEDRVTIPMDLAIEKLKKINDPVFSVVTAPFLVEFIIDNNSSSGLKIDNITISTGATYGETLSVAIPSFPYEGKCVFTEPRGDNGGFIVNCRDSRNAPMTLPKNTNLRLVLAGVLQIKEEMTFVRGSFNNEQGRFEDFYLSPKKDDVNKSTIILSSAGTLFILAWGFLVFLSMTIVRQRRKKQQSNDSQGAQ